MIDSDLGTIGTTCTTISRPISRTCSPSHGPRNASKTCHPHQAEQPTSGPESRRRNFSAGAGRCEQKIRFVDACARLSRFSNSAAGLFSVGRRDVARAAVCSRFPATRAPAKQAHRIAFYASADPDHLRAEGTGSSCHRYQPARFPAYAPGQGDCRCPLAVAQF